VVRKRKRAVTVQRAKAIPVSRFAHSPIIIYADDAVRDAAKLMRDKQVGSLIVSETTGEPIGILTEWDLLSRVLAAGRDADKTRIREVMSSPLMKIDSGSDIQDALRIMINRGIRRLAVMEDGALVGTLTQSQIVGNNRRRSSTLPIVEPLKGHQCLYCNSSFSTLHELNEHIETIHRETQYLEIEDKLELQEG
jgi:signal-transduction protein with cAMP-binding, CBS, and nucleotidyltransferase domain